MTDRILFGPHSVNMLTRCSNNYNQTCVPAEAEYSCGGSERRTRNSSGKPKTTSRADLRTHMRSKMLVKRKYCICVTWRCASTPPLQKHGGASGSIPTKEASKPHVTARVWCARKCTTKGLNRSSRQHLHRKLYEFYSVSHVRKTFFEWKTLSTVKDNVRIPGCSPTVVREHNAQVLQTDGFSRGVASPCHFFHKDLEMCILLHGDDF